MYSVAPNWVNIEIKRSVFFPAIPSSFEEIINLVLFIPSKPEIFIVKWYCKSGEKIWLRTESLFKKRFVIFKEGGFTISGNQS